ncbi:MAG TPA: ROK family protein [Bacteroidota bacterium]|jgi:glucokinase|nr:ROK family protein [Bacteroidota bacterium]
MKAIGVDLGGTNVRCGLVEDEKIINLLAKSINSSGTEIEVLNDIFLLLDDLVADDIEGIGIGVPSVVDVENGIVYDVYNIPSWKSVPIKNILEKRYNKPVYVNNDANCFALGEKYFGKAKKYNNIVGLIIGTGLGAGIIINGKLYNGTNCGAGEFGMIPFKDDILEHYCSGYFFKKKYDITGEELYNLAVSKDEFALNVFREYGKNLGEAIKIILYAIDPEIIVMGGSVSKSFKYFKDALFETISDFGYPKSLEKLKIEVSDVANVAILGAVGLLMDKDF